MRVYDFDKTIYNGDSTRDFYFYCIRRYPRILFCLPYQFFHFCLYMIGVHSKTAFKERFYCFFQKIPHIDAVVSAFWETNFCKIKGWYLAQKQESDVIISASPAFLLALPCKKLGITPPIASLVDMKSGHYTGENCYGEEKPLRFHAEFPNAKISAFYSDSLSDTPMAHLAAESFIVKGHTCIPWQEYSPSHWSKFVRTFLSPTFVRFLLVGVLNTASSILFSTLYSAFLKDATLAYAAGYVTTLTLSYLLNSVFTFKKSFSFIRFLKFAASYIPNFFIQCIFVFLLCDVLFLPRVLSFVAAAILGIPVTFLCMKFYAFKK